MSTQRGQQQDMLVLAIGNVFEFNERYHDNLSVAQLIQRRQAKANFSVSAEMALMWGGDVRNRLVVLPVAPDSLIVGDAERWLNATIQPITPKLETGWVCRDLLNDTTTFESLIERLKGYKVRVIPWGVTRYFRDVILRLRQSGIDIVQTDAPPDLNTWSVEYIDGKVGSRSILSRLSQTHPSFRIPDGFVCENRRLASQVAAAMAPFWGQAVVLKSDHGSGGRGVRLLLEQEQNVRTATDYLLTMQDADFWIDAPVIVEEAIGQGLHLTTPTFDGWISPDGSIEFKGVGNMLMTEHQFYVGVEMGNGVLSPDLDDELRVLGLKVGDIIRKLGYAGWYDVDFLVPTDRTSIFGSEINARRTGPAQLIAIAEQLHGPGWHSRYFYKMYERMWLPERINGYSDLRSIILDVNERAHCADAGIIPVLTGSLKLDRPYLGYVIYSPGRESGEVVERELQSRIETSRYHWSHTAQGAAIASKNAAQEQITRVTSGVIWDIDGVLVDTATAYFALRTTLLSTLGLSSEQISYAITSWNRLFWYFDQDDVAGILAALYQEMNIDLPPSYVFEAALATYLESWSHALQPIPGVVNILTKLQKDGIPMGVVSNGNERLQRQKLATAGLSRYFHESAILISAPDSPHAKPHPSSILAVCHALGIAPATTIYVGDRTADVIAANLAGVMSIRFSPSRSLEVLTPPDEGELGIERATYFVSTAEELSTLLESDLFVH